MEFLVSNCAACGGLCCRCLVTGGEYKPFWISVTPEQVAFYNPWIPVSVNLEQHQWASCQFLNEDGHCIDYAERSSYCRRYPNFDSFLFEYLDDVAFFYCPWCYYRSIVLEIKGIPFIFLDTGEQCMKHYLEQFKTNPPLSKQFIGNF